MKKFIIYDSAGKILRTGACPDNDYELQCSADEFIMEGVADDESQMVVEGQIVNKPANSVEPELVIWQNKAQRNELLRETDWTQANDSPLSDADQLKYRTYRQALRDLTTHENWPELNQEDWPTLET